MSEKFKKLSYQQKYYWDPSIPIQRINLFLAEDWNKIDCITVYRNQAVDLSSILTATFGNPIDIEDTLIEITRTIHPPTSYLNSVNGLTNESMSGIATLTINNEVYDGKFDLKFLPTNTELLNTLNGKSGELTNVLTGIYLSGNLFTSTEANLGEFFSQNESMVSQINIDKRGELFIISSITIEGTTYNTVTDDNFINITNFGLNFFKKNESLNFAYINNSTSNDDNDIVTLRYFNQLHQCSAILQANTSKTIQHVVEWVSITNDNYDVIYPTSLSLVDGTLTVTVPQSGIIYFFSEV